MTRLAALVLVLTGCATTTHDIPTPSAAAGVRRLGPAVSTTPAASKDRHRRRHTLPTSRYLHRRSLPTRPAQNWPALARCESSGNPRAVDPTGRYFGLYQFDVQTWRSIGGVGLPSDASPAEQTARAELLYASRGATPWPVCGSNL